MALIWFDPPVYVKTSTTGMTAGITHVQGAAEHLVQWGPKGRKWRKAVEACMEALEGRMDPYEFRKLFEAAAKEQGMLREWQHP